MLSLRRGQGELRMERHAVETERRRGIARLPGRSCEHRRRQEGEDKGAEHAETIATASPSTTVRVVSMSLFVWKSPVVTETDDAKRLLALEDESVFEASDDVIRFFEELMERLPPPEAFTDDELEAGATPWADAPEASDRLVALSVRWGADDDDLDVIVELAREHDLVLYDPQGPSFHSPGGDEETPYSPTPGEFVRGVLLAAFGVLVVVVSWKLSIPVLTWILVFLGGFVALVAVLSLAAISRQAWRTRAMRAQ